MIANKINTFSVDRMGYAFLSAFILIGLLFVIVPPVSAQTYCPALGYVTDAETCDAATNNTSNDNATDLGGPTNTGDSAESTSYSFGNCDKNQVGIECLADEIFSFLSIAVGIAVVAGITVGGITYSMSRGNPSGTQKGVTIITNAIIGLILYLLMFAIVNFLVPGGILS